MFTITNFIQNRFGSLAIAISEKKQKWGIHIQEVKLFVYHMILYTEYPKDAIRKLPDIISEFGKVARNKINTQKSVAFLYTNNKSSEN